MPEDRFHVLQRREVEIPYCHLRADAGHQPSRLLILKVHLQRILLCLRAVAMITKGKLNTSITCNLNIFSSSLPGYPLLTHPRKFDDFTQVRKCVLARYGSGHAHNPHKPSHRSLAGRCQTSPFDGQKLGR